jgi:hypothetical protein
MTDVVQVRLADEEHFVVCPNLNEAEAERIRDDATVRWIETGDRHWCRVDAIAEMRIVTVAEPQLEPEPGPERDTLRRVGYENT